MLKFPSEMQRWAAKYSSWSRWQVLPFSCITSSSLFFLPCSLYQTVSPKTCIFFLFSWHAVFHWLPTKRSKAPRQNLATNLQASVSAAGIEAPWGGQPRGSQPLGLGGCHLASLSATIYLLAKIHQLSDCLAVLPEGTCCFFNSHGKLNVSHRLSDLLCILSVVCGLLFSFCLFGLHLGIALQNKLYIVIIFWRIFSAFVVASKTFMQDTIGCLFCPLLFSVFFNKTTNDKRLRGYGKRQHRIFHIKASPECPKLLDSLTQEV